MRLRSVFFASLALVGSWVTGATAQVTNDSPCSPISLSQNGAELAFTTVGATETSVPLDCHPGLHDVWFRSINDDSLMITVLPSGTSPMVRPVISVYADNGCALSSTDAPLACSETLFQNGIATLHLNHPTRLGTPGILIRVAASSPSSDGTATIRIVRDTTFATSTYQGQLKENGIPANGSFDVRLATFNAPTGGAVFFVTENRGVSVVDGLFTCPIRFDPDAITGIDLYIEAQVRPNGSLQAYTPLSPRQRLVSVPHALMASEAHFSHTAEWDGLLHMPADFMDGVDDLRGLGGPGVSELAAHADHAHNKLLTSISGGGTIAVTVTTSGNVGIGVLDPSARLHVQHGASGIFPSASASAAFERDTTNYVQILSPNANEKGLAFGSPLSGFAGGIYYTNATGMSFRTGTNDTRMTIDATGLVGIGRTPTANTLEVNGGASKTTAGSWIANSDARIKQDIRPVTNALATLDRVNLVSFVYTPEYRAAHEGIDDRRYLNVIAQQFQTVFPDWVQSSGEKMKDGSSILQVDTYPLTIYSAAAVQELNAKVKSLEEMVASQRRQLAEQEARMRALEAAVLGNSKK